MPSESYEIVPGRMPRGWYRADKSETVTGRVLYHRNVV